MGKFSAFNLPLKTLCVGTHEFDYKLDKQFFANMEYADVHDADLSVHLDLTYRNDIYALHFTISGTITLLCDRCLDDLVLPIETTYDINVEFGEDYNDESDDLLIIPSSDNYLNVSYMLFDTVVLEIPIKHVHPLGKCNRQMSALLRKHRATVPGDIEGLEEEVLDTIDAAEDAAEAPVDPRWAALKGLKENSED